MKMKNNKPLGQSMSSRQENPRLIYEASGQPERPSTLERGSSTTKTCQAVPTRVYQSDQPSLIAARTLRTLPQGFDKPPDKLKSE